MSKRCRAVIVTGLLGFGLGGCPSTSTSTPDAGAGAEAGPTSFSYEIDPSLAPKPDNAGGQPLAVVADSSGKRSTFVANEVWISPASEAALKDFLARSGGTVVGNDAVPAPPPGSAIKVDPSYAQPTQYSVRLDPSKVDLTAFGADATRAGLKGKVRISGEAGARLLALVVRERAAGVKAGPNFLLKSSLLRTSREHPQSDGTFVDAFKISRFLATGSRASVTAAWQLVDDRKSFSRVRVAIIDGGFWLDDAGRPLSALPSGLSDLPADIPQYDFVGGDYVASSRCTDSSDCGFHGNNSASIALGRLDNQYGSAGTGGQVADPMLFAFNFRFDQLATAIRTAVAWGAQVISMSLGGGCDDLFCGEFGGLYPAMRNAWSNNVVMVAAAGNGGDDAIGDVSTEQPCRGDHVICVGALADDARTAIGYSNHGSFVDIWAPTNIPTMPNGDSGGSLPNGSGTSAATPFVAGIVAMMRAYNPTLDADQLRDLLRSTAWTDSSDPKVTHAVNAYRALRAAMTSEHNAAPDVAVTRTGTTGPTADLNRGFNVRADTLDLEDGSPCCTVSWVPTPTSTSDSGRSAVFTFTSQGPRTLTATAIDSGGKSAAGTLAINVVNTVPVATILQPAGNTSVLVGQPLQLSGTATDKNEGPGPGPGTLPCSALKWDSIPSGAPFPLTGCTGSVVFTTPGTRTLRLTATDPQGWSAYPTVSVSVLPAPANYPPTITVGNFPPPNYNGGYDAAVPIAVTGSATDPEGNTPIVYLWRVTTYYPNGAVVYGTSNTIIGTSANLNWTPAVTTALLIPNCSGPDAYSGQKVELKLEATDSLGNKSTKALPAILVFKCVLI